MCHRVPRHLHQPHPRQGRQVSVSAIPVHTSIQIITQDSRLLHYLIREIKTWLNSNHITVHNNTYILKLKEQLLKIQKLHNKQTSNLRNSHTHTHTRELPGSSPLCAEHAVGTCVSLSHLGDGLCAKTKAIQVDSPCMRQSNARWE